MCIRHYKKQTGAAALCLLATGMQFATITPSNAQGQTHSRDILIGVSTPRTADSNAAQMADDLYATASRAIRRGEVPFGQRQLELLVARYPDTEAAQRARRDLAAIYGDPKVTVSLPDPKPSHLGALDASGSQPATSAWRTTVQARSARTDPQESLRAAAGDLVFFSEGSADLGSRSRKALAAQASWLQAHPEQMVVVEGHADESGTASELQALSHARAQAVRDRLVAEGVDAARIRIVARAAERRAVTCPESACANQNRRAVLVVGADAGRAVH